MLLAQIVEQYIVTIIAQGVIEMNVKAAVLIMP